MNFWVPMDFIFTPIIWNYHSFGNKQVADIYFLADLFNPIDIFQRAKNELELKAPKISEGLLKRILETAEK